METITTNDNDSSIPHLNRKLIKRVASLKESVDELADEAHPFFVFMKWEYHDCGGVPTKKDLKRTLNVDSQRNQQSRGR